MLKTLRTNLSFVSFKVGILTVFFCVDCLQKEKEPTSPCSKFYLLSIPLIVLETARKCSIVHIPDIPPNHVQVTSALHHQIDQTFLPISVIRNNSAQMFACEREGLGTREKGKGIFTAICPMHPTAMGIK